MNIVSGNKLNRILESCKIRFDEGLVQLDRKKYPPNTGRFVLLMEFRAPENLTGLSSSNEVIEQFWILDKEISMKKFLAKSTNLFEFEFIYERSHKSKMHIPSVEFLPVLLNLRKENGEIIDYLHDTVGLKYNKEIIRLFNEKRSTRLKEKGLDKIKPRKYYDENFGSKSDEERELREEANKVLNNYGTGQGSCEAQFIYGKMIELNPHNAYAYFNRGLAIMDCWNYQKIDYWLFDNRKREIKEAEIKDKEIKAIKDAESDFRKAIGLIPYLSEDYDKLKREGRIFEST